MTEAADKTMALTARVVIAYVQGNHIPAGELPELVTHVNQLLEALYRGDIAAIARPQTLGNPHPAVPVEQSVTPDYIVSLEDGKRFRSLTRHLKSRYGLTPAEYRARWNLPPGYPMVAPNYSRMRARIAKEARQRQLRRHSRDKKEG